jgi:cytochrome oxidase Cu insertion factor (SCO1/SenC/PrrC family)
MTVARLPARRRTGVPVRLAVAILFGAVVLGVGGGILLREGDGTSAAAAAPRASLPAFHGQGSWKRGERPAPDFALHDQNGTLVSLRSLRGKPVLLTFLDSQCTTRCPIEGRQLGSVLRRLPAGDRPAIVVVSVDRAGDTPRGIRHALAKWHLTGPWTIHWLNAPSRARLAAVWRLYGIQVEPTSNDIVHSLALYLIDRRGDERTAYLFPFLQSFVQHDLARLARERA